MITMNLPKDVTALQFVQMSQVMMDNGEKISYARVIAEIRVNKKVDYGWL